MILFNGWKTKQNLSFWWTFAMEYQAKPVIILESEISEKHFLYEKIIFFIQIYFPGKVSLSTTSEKYFYHQQNTCGIQNPAAQQKFTRMTGFVSIK